MSHWIPRGAEERSHPEQEESLVTLQSLSQAWSSLYATNQKFYTSEDTFPTYPKAKPRAGPFVPSLRLPSPPFYQHIPNPRTYAQPFRHVASTPLSTFPPQTIHFQVNNFDEHGVYQPMAKPYTQPRINNISTSPAKSEHWGRSTHTTNAVSSLGRHDPVEQRAA